MKNIFGDLPPSKYKIGSGKNVFADESARLSLDCAICGAMSLSDQISAQRAGAHSVSTRPLTDANYDEDDSVAVDPSVDLLDKFERAQAITDQISYRTRKHREDKLKNLDV